jgi:antirestriction protein
MSSITNEIVSAWLANNCGPLGDLAEAYQGTWDSEIAFAQELLADTADLDTAMGSLACYFDYKAFARDLFSGDYWSADTADGMAVFLNV